MVSRTKFLTTITIDIRDESAQPGPARPDPALPWRFLMSKFWDIWKDTNSKFLDSVATAFRNFEPHILYVSTSCFKITLFLAGVGFDIFFLFFKYFPTITTQYYSQNLKVSNGKTSLEASKSPQFRFWKEKNFYMVENLLLLVKSNHFHPTPSETLVGPDWPSVGPVPVAHAQMSSTYYKINVLHSKAIVS